ncbi:uncharacterized protein LOC128238154 [Mya arenaria]|uniref:uncharacterized protein LOC128238154 n=1 Tax=Mya arenaria TaxID=6604 RepID=UPI0022DF3236|nr:uncharacterized protein LOC128238154 [Mya arenaria]
MDAYQQETHYWPLRCYPRPEYFHTRLKDIFPRFKRLIGAFPKRFHGVTYRQTLDRLQSLVTMFDCDIKFTLHGKEVPPYKEFLYHNPGADEINTEGCKADHKLQLTKAATLENSSLSGHEVKIFFADMKDFNEIVHELKQVPVQKDMSIFLAFDSDLTEIEKESIMSQLESIETKANVVQVSLKRKELMFQISMTLETMLVTGFSLLQEFILNFIGKAPITRGIDTIEELVEESNITVVLATYLYDAQSVIEKDIDNDCDTKDECKKDIFQKTYTRFANCLLFPFLSDKHGVSAETVRHIVEEFDYESKFVGTLTEDLRKRVIDCTHIDGYPRHFMSVRKSVQKLTMDILIQQEGNILNLQKITKTAMSLYTTLEKLLFEVERCLERTITGEFNLTTRVRSIPPQLKKELLRIKHVLMIGNVYDKIAVFVDVESTHGEKATDVETSEARVDDRLNENRKEIDNQSSRESKDRSGFYRKSSVRHNTQQEIKNVLQKYGVTSSNSYVIEYVSNKLPEFARPHHLKHEIEAKNLALKPATDVPGYGTGQPIQTCDLEDQDTFREGTLGCFLSSDSTLYAMTCAHVLFRKGHMQKSSEAYMYSSENPNYLVFLGHNSPSDVIFQSPDAMLVDCALCKVDTYMKHEAIRQLRDTTNKTKPSEYYSGDRKGLVGEHVYKYGAKTGLTYGTIASINLIPKSCSGETDNDYLIWIDSEADTNLSEGGLMAVHEMEGATAVVEETCFAQYGDSGAVVLMTHIDKKTYMKQNEHSTKNLVALSMVSHGDLQMMGKTSKLVMTFQLDKAVSLLENKMNAQLKLE